MKERPILFSGEMARALLAGTKSQTRRAVKLPHQNPLGVWEPSTFGGPNGGRTARGETIPEHGVIWHTRTGDVIGCPYGIPGDRLWVRETWGDCSPGADAVSGTHYAKPLFRADADAYGLLGHDGEGPIYVEDVRWRPSIHMPRAHSRITLELTDVRVERLHDISEADARAEGVSNFCNVTDPLTGEIDREAVDAFEALWKLINGSDSWNANPWVWVLTFRRLPG